MEIEMNLYYAYAWLKVCVCIYIGQEERGKRVAVLIFFNSHNGGSNADMPVILKNNMIIYCAWEDEI